MPSVGDCPRDVLQVVLALCPPDSRAVLRSTCRRMHRLRVARGAWLVVRVGTGRVPQWLLLVARHWPFWGATTERLRCVGSAAAVTAAVPRLAALCPVLRVVELSAAVSVSVCLPPALVARGVSVYMPLATPLPHADLLRLTPEQRACVGAVAVTYRPDADWSGWVLPGATGLAVHAAVDDDNRLLGGWPQTDACVWDWARRVAPNARDVLFVAGRRQDGADPTAEFLRGALRSIERGEVPGLRSITCAKRVGPFVARPEAGLLQWGEVVRSAEGHGLAWWASETDGHPTGVALSLAGPHPRWFAGGVGLGAALDRGTVRLCRYFTRKRIRALLAHPAAAAALVEFGLDLVEPDRILPAHSVLAEAVNTDTSMPRVRHLSVECAAFGELHGDIVRPVLALLQTLCPAVERVSVSPERAVALLPDGLRRHVVG